MTRSRGVGRGNARGSRRALQKANAKRHAQATKARQFITRYNTEWLIERLGHQTPVAARTAAMAA